MLSPAPTSRVWPSTVKRSFPVRTWETCSCGWRCSGSRVPASNSTRICIRSRPLTSVRRRTPGVMVIQGDIGGLLQRSDLARHLKFGGAAERLK